MSAFPPTSGVDPAQALHNYLMVAEDYDADLVEEAVTLYVKGLMPGFDGRFAPTPPMLATGCRKAAENRQRAAYFAGLVRPALPPPDIEKTPEQRERAKAKVAEFLASLDAPDSDVETVKRRNAQFAKTNARFMPDMSDEAVKARLMKGTRYSVGDGEAA